MKHRRKGFIQVLAIPQVWLVVILIVLALFLFTHFGLLSIFYDSYLIEDDFVNGLAKWEVIDGNPRIEDAGYGEQLMMDGKIRYLVNLKNRDIKIKGMIMPTASGSINFGSQNIFSMSTSCGVPTQYNPDVEFVVELIKDVTDKDKFIVIVNGDVSKEVIITEEEAYLEFSGSRFGVRTYCAEFQVNTGTMFVEYVKSKPYFSCEIDEGEVVVRDSFNSGSTFDIHSLTYEPTKFCPQDYPAVVRDFSQGGVKADIRGTITEQLTRGNSFTVPQNQVYEIMYGTRYKEGMAERCTLGQVYDTNTKKCVQKVFEQEEIIKIIREKEYIKIGKNQKFFEKSLKIGDSVIYSTRPEFVCNDEGEDWNAPQPNSNCWQANVKFKNMDINMYDGAEINLNQYFDLKLHIAGHYESDSKLVDSYTNNFILTIKDYSFITLQTKQDDYFVIKDTNRDMCFSLNNKLGIGFSDGQAGYSLLKTTDLVTTQERTLHEKAIPTGEMEYCLPIDTDMYGEVTYNVMPHFKLGDEIFFDDEQITHNYKIVDEIPTDIVIVTCESKGCPYGFDCIDGVCVEQKTCGFFCKFWRWLKCLFSKDC